MMIVFYLWILFLDPVAIRYPLAVPTPAVHSNHTMKGAQ